MSADAGLKPASPRRSYAPSGDDRGWFDRLLRSVKTRQCNAAGERTLAASAERVLIEIADECGGLDDANLTVRSLDELPTDGSMGIGLAFSRWGVEANNGRIYARNLPDKGCVFTVDLPRPAA